MGTALKTRQTSKQKPLLWQRRMGGEDEEEWVWADGRGRELRWRPNRRHRRRDGQLGRSYRSVNGFTVWLGGWWHAYVQGWTAGNRLCQRRHRLSIPRRRLANVVA